MVTNNLKYIDLCGILRLISFPIFFLIIVVSSLVRAETTIYQGNIFHFTDDPSINSNAYQYIENGGLVIEKGIVKDIISESDLTKYQDRAKIIDYSGKIIFPGFIDLHIHYPQTEMIASHGEELLEWLREYTFPTEKKFSDKAYAKEVANFFIKQLYKNGTTSALVFGTVHPESVNALFEVAEREKMRLIAGKVLMDRNAPDYLQDSAESGYAESKTLIERWHNRGRLSYAITPRFAPTSTPQQLELAAKLLNEFPGIYMQTHLAENRKEVEWVKQLFPQARSYLDVYSLYGLNRDRSIFAHAIYVDNMDLQSIAKAGSAIAFCPSSNLFLGSGLFPLYKAESHAVDVGFGTDVGAGTSFSMFQTMADAYKVIQLQKSMGENTRVRSLSPFKAFYLATLGAAKSLNIENKIGNFEKGREADFIVIDLEATDLLKFRMKHAKNLEEQLFALQILGDDRSIYRTYISGEQK
ncbi:guanine deaminase [Microbulbifer sp. OS29]|uniref:Guanine deaminase n=1 Tax=Microbulbifer okhotskensis TaxID=2926617 RepID=A0A9X2J560_9GAMM|nr:guanine deaminase [Microbulbifer okhotskensis]MCO1334873.1 guanine deaminase [Microbulbifer okhotskensis]